MPAGGRGTSHGVGLARRRLDTTFSGLSPATASFCGMFHGPGQGVFGFGFA